MSRHESGEPPSPLESEEPLVRHEEPAPDPGSDPVADQGGDPGTEVVDPAPGTEQRAILANTAVMAAGTVFSRLSGFVRNALLAAALGVTLHADIFTVANTLPNMLYILLAGGVFNAVLVPQLVRSMKNDPDGGAAYINRVMTLAGLFLGVVTVLLVVAAPWVMSVILSSQYDDPALADARSSAIDFARYCLPQVFFYGMFVLIGQVLNARGRFGPMMWAPIANNVISVGVLVAYLFAFGAATPAEQEGPFTSGQELLLGIGSTAGIAAQLLILVPYLRAAGVRYRPRFDFRGVGLGHTLRLGVWTVLFVIVNQIAYVVVVKLASGGTASSDAGTGITVYSSVMLVVMVPHAIITVSLATAILPRLSAAAAANDPGRLGATLGSTLRTALVVVVPFAALLPALALPVARVIWGHGATADRYDRFETSMILFGVGVVAFTVHYLVLRGFYALELNRLVFFVQCAIAATNIVLATVLVGRTDEEHTAPMLVLAYTGAYAVGSLISAAVLARRLRRAGAAAPDVRGWTGFVLRLLLAAAAVCGVGLLLDLVVTDTVAELSADPSWWFSLVELAVVGLGAGGAFLAVASLLRLREVTSVLAMVQARVRR